MRYEVWILRNDGPDGMIHRGTDKYVAVEVYDEAKKNLKRFEGLSLREINVLLLTEACVVCGKEVLEDRILMSRAPVHEKCYPSEQGRETREVTERDREQESSVRAAEGY